MGMQPPVSTGRPATAPLAEHKAWSVPGVLALVPGLVALVVGIGLLISALTSSAGSNAAGGWAAILLLIARAAAERPDRRWSRARPGWSSCSAATRARSGTPGWRWVNPFTERRKVSTRIRNHETAMAKVNDADGNPIEIAAVVVWQVADTAKALYAVDDYPKFVAIQTETAVRHIASSYPYTSHGDGGLSLRDNADGDHPRLSAEIADRVAPAGVTIIESRLTRLAYAPEIAQAMLRQQQASAVVGARPRIVEGAVGMVQLALQRLKDEDVVDLDEERKAAMVSNLLVVLCSEQATQQVVNTGSLYQ